jgi:O-antigen/teichoic acid export membrane protein
VAGLLGTLMGQVDIVLITAGKSSWSLLNALLVLVTNVALDFWLIPTHGILGAAIAWAVAMTVSNVVPLAQLFLVFKLHPFGRGSLIAATLTLISFGIVPLAIKAVLGGSWLSVAAGTLVGCVLMTLGLARCRRSLKLSTMPGLGAIEARIRARWPGRW